MRLTHPLAQAAERRAEAYLHSQGYRTRHRNWHCRYGEWDLILDAPQGGLWVFVEVRYRSRPLGGSASAAVDARKQKRLSRCAGCYLATWSRETGQNPPACRFDVVALEGQTVAQATLRWIRDAFYAVN